MAQNAAEYAAICQFGKSITAYREWAKRDRYALNDAEIIPGMVAIALPRPLGARGTDREYQCRRH